VSDVWLTFVVQSSRTDDKSISLFKITKEALEALCC